MAKRKNDDGRGPVYMAADGTYHATAKLRDAHENSRALVEWLDASGGLGDVAAAALVDEILANGAEFLSLLRKAGVRAKRGSKVAAAEKQAA